MKEATQKAIEGGWWPQCIKEGDNINTWLDRDLINDWPLVTSDPLFWQALGKAMGKNGVPVTAGNGSFTFIVDQEFVPELANWSWELQKGYVRGTKKLSKGKTKAFLHRIVIGRPIGAGEMVDHINGNRLDNRLVNLRVVDAGQSARNKNAIKSGKYRGTYFYKPKKLWAAVVVFDRKKHYAGYFKDRDEAAEAVEKLRQELYGVLYNKSDKREWWHEQMHRFIDHLAEGKDADSFFKELLGLTLDNN